MASVNVCAYYGAMETKLADTLWWASCTWRVAFTNNSGGCSPSPSPPPNKNAHPVQSVLSIGVLVGKIDGYPWLIEPPGKPGIVLYLNQINQAQKTWKQQVNLLGPLQKFDPKWENQKVSSGRFALGKYTVSWHCHLSSAKRKRSDPEPEADPPAGFGNC